MGRVLVVGAGYVGLCTGAALAESGHHVTLVDLDARKLEAVTDGRAPFHEPGLDELVSRHVASGRLRTAQNIAAAEAPSFVILCVGTPGDASGAADLRFVEGAARDVAGALPRWPRPVVVITKSTVPPGTTRGLVRTTIERVSGLRAGADFHVASVPEFLREGAAVRDALSPDRIVVGADEPEAARLVWTLFEAHRCPRVEVDCTTAEMVKYSANAFLATKVALANELANVAAKHGVDWYRVAEGIGHDPRIGPLFLRAGVGFGGSCFPKDVAAIAGIARASGAPSHVLEAVLATNEEQPLVAVRMLEDELGALGGKRIALLGLAFKPDTDDVRATRALPIYDALRKAGAHVVVHDPVALDNFERLVGHLDAKAPTVEDALRGADGCIIQTEWRSYASIDPRSFLSLMRTPVVVDGRRTCDPDAMRAAGVRYRAIGLGAP